MIPDKLKKLFALNVIKTLYVNFYYLPFRTACKVPIFIYKNVNLSKIGGVKLRLMPKSVVDFCLSGDGISAH